MADVSKQAASRPLTLAGWLTTGWLKQFIAEIIYRVRLLAWPLLLGVVLLVISLIVALAILLPQASEIKQLQEHVAQLRQHAPGIESARVDSSPQALLKNFYKTLPPESDAPRLVGVVLRALSNHGITPDRVEYQLSPSNKLPYKLYVLTLPVHAEYVAVRKFVNQILNTLPNAAISEMSFRRDETGDGLVEARLRITLYMSASQQ